MGIVKKLFNSTRKPEGLLGELMVKSMNKGHAAVSDWGMEHITKLHPSKIIDLGCGGGRNAAELLKRFPAATVHALDYSEVSVQKTKQFNQQAIKNGRLQVTHANVLNLPFSADTIVNESDGTNKADDKWLKIIDNMKIYTVEQLEFFLTEAGFSEITIDHKNKKHHICILAKK